MEWMLQVVDELDDALAIVKQYAQAVGFESGLTVASSATAVALCAVLLRSAG